MATYKVLQDIEAEDTLVGSLTIRQCIYAGIAITAGYLSYLVIAKGAWFLSIFFLPFVAMGIFFAFPWTKHQTTEVWALAKVRFFLKPRKRIWNQSGVKQLVTITAPKKITKSLRRNLSPEEAQNRVHALADTIDSRGWAVKNIDLGYFTHPSGMTDTESDRLIAPTNLLQEVPGLDPNAAEDMFDSANSSVAHKFDALMTKSETSRHEQLIKQVDEPAPAAITQYWHMKTIQPPKHDVATPSVPTPTSTALPAHPNRAPSYTPRATQPESVSDRQAKSLARPNVHYERPQTYAAFGTPREQTVTAPTDPAILGFASNDDLTVATIQREAQRTMGPNDEVVVSLHNS